MISSGFAPLDAQLGGLSANRLHLLTGGPGTGKSAACLQFLDAGLRRGEPVALLTLDLLPDLISHARCSGIDLERAIRTGRFLLVRFRAEFGRLLERSGSPSTAIDDLRRLIVEVEPRRLVIDPLTPFLADGFASASALAALAQLLDELSVTTIVTYPRDVSGGCDERLDPIVQRAAAVLHLARGNGGVSQMHVIQARAQVAPVIAHTISTTGLGLVPVVRDTHSLEKAGTRSSRRRKRSRQPEAST